MEWYYIVFIVLGAIILLILSLSFLISYFLCKFMVEPYCAPLHEVLDREFKLNKISKD